MPSASIERRPLKPWGSGGSPPAAARTPAAPAAVSSAVSGVPLASVRSVVSATVMPTWFCAAAPAGAGANAIESVKKRARQLVVPGLL